ncbi:MAG: hypothetical protein EOO36_15620 [Cytophagaceae bacterium]|nr:MAG: hypothetical protein EOO36_15620 [Cytophagaceae bacterium]
MTRTLRLLAFAAALPLALSACSSGTEPGDVNVERGSNKKINGSQQPSNGDSLAAGIPRDTSNHPTGRQLYQNANQSRDKNHDGLAD